MTETEKLATALGHLDAQAEDLDWTAKKVAADRVARAGVRNQTAGQNREEPNERGRPGG